MDFFLLLFASIGLSHIMVDGSIFTYPKKKLEDWSSVKWVGGLCAMALEMLSCYQCSGVWAGWLVGLVGWFAGMITLWHVLLLGFAVAVFSPLLTTIITFFNVVNTNMLKDQIDQ